MRSIHVHTHQLLLEDTDAERLIKAGLLYQCKQDPVDEDLGHDLHLDPYHKWRLEDIEDLLTSILHK